MDKSRDNLPPLPSADFTLPQPIASYTEQDHQTWQRLARRQLDLLPGRVCPEFLDGQRALGLDGGGIPDFAALSQRLMAKTGWQVVAVPGLVPDEVFFRHLAERRFPAAHWVRKPEAFDYIEEPDVFHDVFGHVPLFMEPRYADFVAAYGQASLKAMERGTLHHLARLYWYTVEFGLVKTRDGLRIFGAGIASSPGETVFALESTSPNRIAFDHARTMRTRYRIDDYQETYMVLDGFDALPDLSEQALLALERNIGADLDPSQSAPSDVVLTRGTGAYHRDRSAA